MREAMWPASSVRPRLLGGPTRRGYQGYHQGYLFEGGIRAIFPLMGLGNSRVQGYQGYLNSILLGVGENRPKRKVSLYSLKSLRRGIPVSLVSLLPYFAGFFQGYLPSDRDI
jgi:hypothetical protein